MERESTITMEFSLIKSPKTYKVQSRNISLVFNPEAAEKADVLLFDKHQDKLKAAEGQKIFDGAGEYEVNDSLMEGVAINGGVSYRIDADGIAIVHLAAGTSELSDKQIEALSPVDIAMIASQDVSAQDISKIISQLEPRVIIPVGADGETLKKLAEELGVTAEKSAKFKISAKDLPQDSQKLVVVE